MARATDNAKFFGELRSFLATIKHLDPSLRDWLRQYPGDLPEWESWLKVFVPYIKDCRPEGMPLDLSWLYDMPYQGWENAHYIAPWVGYGAVGPLELALFQKAGVTGLSALKLLSLPGRYDGHLPFFALDCLKALKGLPQNLYIKASLRNLIELEARYASFLSPNFKIPRIVLERSEQILPWVSDKKLIMQWDATPTLELSFPHKEDFDSLIPQQIKSLAQYTSWEGLKDLILVRDHLARDPWDGEDWRQVLLKLAEFAPGNLETFTLRCRETHRVDLTKGSLVDWTPYLLDKLEETFFV